MKHTLSLAISKATLTPEVHQSAFNDPFFTGTQQTLQQSSFTFTRSGRWPAVVETLIPQDLAAAATPITRVRIGQTADDGHSPDPLETPAIDMAGWTFLRKIPNHPGGHRP